MEKRVDISFITVNYNGFDDTCDLLESIGANVLNNIVYEVIVVDNASSLSEADKIAEIYPHVKLIKNTQNLGFAGGNNSGIKLATGRYIMLINNDALIIDSSIADAIRFMDTNPEIGAVSPKILYHTPPGIIQYAGFTELSSITLRNKTIGQGEPDNGKYDVPRQTAYIHGAAAIIRRSILSKTALLPEIFFLYYEEIDWSFSIRDAGYSIWYYPGCSVVHKESRNTGGYSFSKRFYITRNRLLIAYRRRGGIIRVLSLLYLIFIPAIKDIVVSSLKGEFNQSRAIFKGVSQFIKMKKQ